MKSCSTGMVGKSIACTVLNLSTDTNYTHESCFVVYMVCVLSFVQGENVGRDFEIEFSLEGDTN